MFSGASSRPAPQKHAQAREKMAAGWNQSRVSSLVTAPSITIAMVATMETDIETDQDSGLIRGLAKNSRKQ